VTKSMELQDIGWAINRLRDGERVFRRGWNGKGQYVRLMHPAEDSDMTLPYIFIRTVQDDYVPWLASQTDILAADWELKV
jgi:hypothetical protein